QQARRGLAAVAEAAVGGQSPFGMMGAEIEALQSGALFFEHPAQALLHAAQRIESELAKGDAGLVRHDDERQPQTRQTPYPFTSAAREAHFSRVGVIRYVLKHGSVLVEENGGCHGHDVSFMGSTITSGTTVSGGWVSTNLTARAT